MKGIPTTYSNYRFRSRLEAKWACFFDLIGWKWEYEPVDFSGWIPDFAIYGEKIIYVEVKPVVKFPEEVSRKIEQSGCDTEILILGQTIPVPHHEYYSCEIFGWLGQAYGNEDLWWDKAALGIWSNTDNQIGFCHSAGSFHDRITGKYDGGSWGSTVLSERKIKKLWATACNKTQWNK